MSGVSVVPGSMCPIHHFVSTKGVPRKVCLANAIQGLSEYSTSSMRYKLLRTDVKASANFRTVSLLAFDPKQIAGYISPDVEINGEVVRFLPDYYRVPWKKNFWRFALLQGRVALRYSSTLGVSMPLDISGYLLGRLDIFEKWRPESIEICPSIPDPVAQNLSNLLTGWGLDESQIKVCEVQLTDKIPNSLIVEHDFCGPKSRVSWFALLAVAMALVFQLTTQTFGNITNSKSLEWIQSETADVFYEVFPETVPMLDPIQQVRRHLSELESEWGDHRASTIKLGNLFWGIHYGAIQHPEVAIVSISKNRDANYRIEYSAPSHKVAQKYLTWLENELNLDLRINASKVEEGVVFSSINIGVSNG